MKVSTGNKINKLCNFINNLSLYSPKSSNIFNVFYIAGNFFTI